MKRRTPRFTLFPYTTLFRSRDLPRQRHQVRPLAVESEPAPLPQVQQVLELVQRSEEHTSELQSQSNLVCRLLLEKKKKRCITSGQPLISLAAKLTFEFMSSG